MTSFAGEAAPRFPRRHRQAMVAAGALTVAIGGGIWAGQPAAPADPAEPPLERVVRAGPATLLVPREWRSSSRSTGATTVLAPSPGAPGRVIVTLAAADDRSLVPKPLRDLAQDLGRGPRGTRFAGHLAWRYVGHGRDGNRLDVTVLPTSAGVLGLACQAITPTECAPAIESITLRRPGAAIYAPSPDFTLRLRLPGVLAALDRERVGTRSALRRAATHNATGAAGPRGWNARIWPPPTPCDPWRAVRVLRCPASSRTQHPPTPRSPTRQVPARHPGSTPQPGTCEGRKRGCVPRRISS